MNDTHLYALFGDDACFCGLFTIGPDVESGKWRRLEGCHVTQADWDEIKAANPEDFKGQVADVAARCLECDGVWLGDLERMLPGAVHSLGRGDGKPGDFILYAGMGYWMYRVGVLPRHLEPSC